MTFPAPGARPAIGTWVKLPTPESVELVAVGGVDFVVIDMEHGTLTLETVSTMIAIAHGCGIDAFVRVPRVAGGELAPVLDAGADGVFIPHVDDVETARAAAAACHFPPKGTRGASPSGRAGGWGRTALASYVNQGDEVTVVAQLESAAALADAAAITAVDGIDAAFFGAVDLAVSTGLGLHDDGFRRMHRAAERACQAGGVVTGAGATTPDEIRDVVERGHRLVLVATDVALLRGAATDAVAAVDAAVAEWGRA